MLSGTRRQEKIDGSEVSVVAGSWNWRSAMNMPGCRRVSSSSTYLAIGDRVAYTNVAITIVASINPIYECGYGKEAHL